MDTRLESFMIIGWTSAKLHGRTCISTRCVAKTIELCSSSYYTTHVLPQLLTMWFCGTTNGTRQFQKLLIWGFVVFISFILLSKTFFLVATVSHHCFSVSLVFHHFMTQHVSSSSTLKIDIWLWTVFYLCLSSCVLLSRNACCHEFRNTVCKLIPNEISTYILRAIWHINNKFNNKYT